MSVDPLVRIQHSSCCCCCRCCCLASIQDSNIHLMNYQLSTFTRQKRVSSFDFVLSHDWCLCQFWGCSWSAEPPPNDPIITSTQYVIHFSFYFDSIPVVCSFYTGPRTPYSFHLFFAVFFVFCLCKNTCQT